MKKLSFKFFSLFLLVIVFATGVGVFVLGIDSKEITKFIGLFIPLYLILCWSLSFLEQRRI